MSIKLLLAEALEILSKAEEAENAADRLQLATAKGQTRTRDFMAVKRQYSAAYDMYIRGLELLNYCRRQGIDNKVSELQQFCTSRMTTYMNRCDQLREKETNILMTVDQADSSICLDKEGFAVGQVIFMKHVEIKQSTPIKFETTLADGAYQLIVKNYDAPGMAQPEVTALITLQGVTGKNLRFAKHVGPRCAWSRYVGVLSSANVSITVSTDAWVRSSKVEVVFRALIPVEPEAPNVVAGPIPSGWIDALPDLPPPVAAPPAPPAFEMPAVPSGDPYQQQPQHPSQPPPPGAPGAYPAPPPQQQQPQQPQQPQQQQPQGPPGLGYPGYPLPPYATQQYQPVQPLGGYGENHADPMAGVQPAQQQQPQQQQQQMPTRPPVTAVPAEPPQKSVPEAAPSQPPVPVVSKPKAVPFRTSIPVPESDDDRALEPDVLALRIAQLRESVKAHIKPVAPRMPSDAKLHPHESAFVSTVKSFPDPTPLLDDMDCGDMDFTVNADDFE